MANERGWRVGELARAAGMTVRTLHYYDEVGLLSPSQHTEAGHRLYTRQDVRRLYRILALRQLGLPLAAIAISLERDGNGLGAIVRDHLAQVEQSIGAQQQLRSRLLLLLGAFDRSEEPSTDLFMQALEGIAMIERYYTPEQLAQLEERRNQLGDEGMRRAEQEWKDLIEAVEAERERGADPAGPRMQELARQWLGLIEQFTGEDAGIRRSLQTMYETEGVDSASRGAVSPDLMAYMQKAMAAAHGSSEQA